MARGGVSAAAHALVRGGHAMGCSMLAGHSCIDSDRTSNARQYYISKIIVGVNATPPVEGDDARQGNEQEESRKHTNRLAKHMHTVASQSSSQKQTL